MTLGYAASESKYDGEDGRGDRYGGREHQFSMHGPYEGRSERARWLRRNKKAEDGGLIWAMVAQGGSVGGSGGGDGGRR